MAARRKNRPTEKAHRKGPQKRHSKCPCEVTQSHRDPQKAHTVGCGPSVGLLWANPRCCALGLPCNMIYTILTHIYDGPDFGFTPSPPCSSTGPQDDEDFPFFLSATSAFSNHVRELIPGRGHQPRESGEHIPARREPDPECVLPFRTRVVIPGRGRHPGQGCEPGRKGLAPGSWCPSRVRSRAPLTFWLTRNHDGR